MATVTDIVNDILNMDKKNFVDTAEKALALVSKPSSENSFQSFSERFASELCSIWEIENDSDEKKYPITLLINLLSEKLAALNESIGGTIKKDSIKKSAERWLKNNTLPDRPNAFKICFALNLDAKKANYLLINVFAQYGFNDRSAEENIFFYCLTSGKSYKDALKMISEYNKAPYSEEDAINSPNSIPSSGSGKTTANIKARMIEGWDTEEDFLSWMKDNKHLFINYRTTFEREYRKVYKELSIQIYELELDKIMSLYIDTELEVGVSENMLEWPKTSADNKIIVEDYTPIQTALDNCMKYEPGLEKEKEEFEQGWKLFKDTVDKEKKYARNPSYTPRPEFKTLEDDIAWRIGENNIIRKFRINCFFLWKELLPIMQKPQVDFSLPANELYLAITGGIPTKEAPRQNEKEPLGKSSLNTTTVLKDFPRDNYLTNLELTFDELKRNGASKNSFGTLKYRKLFVFLYYYNYIFPWILHLKEGAPTLKAFIRSITETLLKCGFSPLNKNIPFDVLIINSVYALQINPDGYYENVVGDPIDLFNKVIELSFMNDPV